MVLSKTEKSFTLIFGIIVLLELFSESLQELLPFHFAPKPLILVSLIIFYATQCRSLSKTTNFLMLAALVFSLTGDVLLMFVNKSAHYFMAGLIAFLLAHIMYIFVFLRKKQQKLSLVLITILLIYAAALFYLLKDGLGDLTIPVIVYMLVILSMTLTASLRKEAVSHLSYTFVIVGAVFFMISDSFLAINKFYKALPYAHFLIMSTYAIAQYLITLGILKEKN